MPVDDTAARSARRRDLERVVFSQGDPAAIERAARELRELDRSVPASDAPLRPTPQVVEAPPEGVVQAAPSEPVEPSVPAEPSVTDALPATDAPPARRRPVFAALAALAILIGGVLLGTVISSAGLDGPVVTSGEQDASSDPLPSPSPGEGVAFIDIDTGQVVGYGGVERAEALEVFDREQTDADRPTFPLAADLQPSTTRLLEMAGSASIFAALDTLARPCLVVVGPNQYTATCQTGFEFPKAGIRLSWAPSVDQGDAISDLGRASPVVYTVVWLPNGMVEVGALVQGP